MRESEFLDWLIRKSDLRGGAIAGVGDDCAVLPLESGRRKRELLLTTDTIVADIDFRCAALGGKRAATAPMSPEQVGRKALAISLSDIAAMGGRPVCALVALAVAPRVRFDAVKRMYSGMERLAVAHHLKIAGGDFSATAGPTVITTTVVGIVEGRGPVRRSGARPGDILLVTGALGGSILRKHWSFTPRIVEGLALRTRFCARAMMDISDGLVLDASRLAARSGVGVTIRAASVPVSADASRLARRTRRAPLEHALYDGEDFELLVAVEARRVPGLLRSWRFHVPLTPVGMLDKQPGIRILDPCGRLREVKPQGYEHRCS
ncbi:MAG: thiamine-phosphate kinase [Planctomycetota bacterium]|nr:thiamine-phosphate kinase [Planctomycetota bacterium]